MSKAMNRKKPSAEPNVLALLRKLEIHFSEDDGGCLFALDSKVIVDALVVSSEEAGNPFEDDGGCLFALDSKVIVDAVAMAAVCSVITSGIEQCNNFVEERLEKRTKPIKKPLRKDKLHVFVQQRKGSETFPDNPPQRLLVVFAAIHCMPGTERGPSRIFQA